MQGLTEIDHGIDRTADQERPRLAGPSRAAELDEIDAQISRLFGLVAEGLTFASEAFLDGNRNAAGRVRRAEVLVDELHHGTEALLERQLHSVTDGIDRDGLARLVLALRITPELERSGDLVEHIAARSSMNVAALLSDDARRLVHLMAQASVELWRRAGAAFGGVDCWASSDFRQLDDELDDLHVQLCEAFAATELPVAVAIELGLVARFFERLGDHAVNVARRVEEHDRRHAELLSA